jgi:subtilisin family serine protease
MIRTLAAIAVLLTGGTAVAAAEPAALGDIRPGAGIPVADSYLVVLADGAKTTAEGVTSLYGGQVAREFSYALRGAEVTMSERAARRLAADPAVAWVERNSVVTVADAAPAAIAPTAVASWGLDRIDQRRLPLDNSFTPLGTGAGARVYVFGTGIRFTHTDFGGRAISGRDVVDNDNDASDCNGLSTHLAGTVGGAQFGVAKQVTMVAIRNVNCTGSATIAQVVASIDWFTANAVRPAVGLFTLGSAINNTIDTAIRNSIATGLPYVLSAGASNADACGFSPGRVTQAITVSTTDMTDTRAGFANFGPCVDIFAPGVNIPSAWFTSDVAISTISGTSSAAAHVAGTAGLLLAAVPTLTPAELSAALAAYASAGVVNNAGPGSPNRLVFAG